MDMQILDYCAGTGPLPAGAPACLKAARDLQALGCYFTWPYKQPNIINWETGDAYNAYKAGLFEDGCKFHVAHPNYKEKFEVADGESLDRLVQKLARSYDGLLWGGEKARLGNLGDELPAPSSVSVVTEDGYLEIDGVRLKIQAHSEQV
jgi:hypothetical protein